MTQKIKTPAGYPREIYLFSEECDLHVMARPNADLDGVFIAWDLDECEFVAINGWLFCSEEVTA